MPEPFIGQIILVPYTFAPTGWAFCAGQLLPIAQNTALFSLIGTTFGGDGQTTFALPDLRGRVPISSGQGPGLQNYDLGQVGGEETVTLTGNQVGAHSHLVNVNSNASDSGKPVNNFLAAGNSFQPTADGSTMNPGMIANGGNSQPHNNIQPYLGLNYCIALQGIFPSRN
ncbi:MAG: phage tail protein [Chloroflexi bacterium]|nr:MAG: phage tail protein [Chloroflexota bacterium]